MGLFQPIYAYDPEPGHDPKDAVTLKEIIQLLREEEDYWDGEQNNTKLMITRLRKIFYNGGGWDSEVIRGAKDVSTRYCSKVVSSSDKHVKHIKGYTNNVYDPTYQEVTYCSDDKVFGDSRAGQVPFIFDKDHQEVITDEGYYCDIAHVFAGLDALNYKQVVTPLPGILAVFGRLFPHVDSNMDFSTWLGDIASSSVKFFFGYMGNHKQELSEEELQKYIIMEAPGSDMIGNIDAYVIAKYYDITAEKGLRISEILNDYYLGTDGSIPLKNLRCTIFCEIIGLQNWNGTSFSNEDKWLRHYKRELKANSAFEIFSQMNETLRSIFMLGLVWIGWYNKELKLKTLIGIFLTAIKAEVQKETMLYATADVKQKVAEKVLVTPYTK